MRNLILGLGLVLAWGPLGAIHSTTGLSRFERQAAGDAAALADFQARVQEYAELHRCLEGSVPHVLSDDWPTIYRATETLRGRIRMARKDARQGDVFTPSIERVFRRMIRECLDECSARDLLATLNEENPEGLDLTPRVNRLWPVGASHGPMPPHLLATLPPLPEELQYRFMNRDLVLLDVHASVIVDFIRQAMP
jgi:hypothetical protein